MGNNKLKNKSEFIFFDFLFWIALGLIFPAIAHKLSFVNILSIVLYLSAVHYVGDFLFRKISVLNNIPFLFKSGIAIITGGIICGLVYIFLPSSIILYALSFFFLIDIFLNKRIVFSFSLNNFLCLIPFFVILFQTYELAYATTERYSKIDGDYFYYTAIVESLKTNHSFTSAIYHIGLPINYSAAPFLSAAELARFSGISSQFALWSVYSKILPIACLGSITYTVVKLYENLFDVQLDNISTPKKQIFVAFMFLLLGPLHFLNLLKLDFKHTLFLGEGYVLPTGSPGFALAMLYSALILLLVFSKIKLDVPHKLAIILFLCIIVASKVALFLPLSILLGSLSFLFLVNKNAELFFTLLVAFPICLFIYKYTLTAKDSTFVIGLTYNGYYQNFFKGLAGKYGISGSSGKKIIVMMSITLFMWLSIKMLILLFSAFSFLNRNYKAASLIAAGIISFVFSLLPGFFINFHGVSSNEELAYDLKFDMIQFVRGSIYLLTLLTLTFALYLIDIHRNHLIRKGSVLLICLWMCIISCSFFTIDYMKAPISDQSWYQEIQSDFIKQKPGLMAMMGNANYSGQTLTSAGVHPWYCTGRFKDKEGYILSLQANDRNILFQKIFDTTLELSTRKSVADSIKFQGVDCIVGSPSSLTKLYFAQKDSLIAPIPGTKWFYRLN